MNWTVQQEEAISAQGRSVIVSAAAGSGKTAVLVERLLRILSDTEHKVRAESIVVVTFTNDAAAQMKQRLTARLTEQLNALADTDDAEAYDWLLEQRASLSSARICTIHSFCFDLIREYAENCHVSPLFSIAEPAQDTLYKKRALQKILERWSRNTEDMELLFSHFCTRDDAELEGVIFSIAEYLESLPFRQEWVRQAIRLSSDAPALLGRIREAFCLRLEELTGMAGMMQHAALGVVPNIPEQKNRYLLKLKEDIAALRCQIESLRRIPDETLLNCPLGTVAKLKKFPGKAKTEMPDEEALEIFRQCCNLYREQYKKLVSGYLEPLRYFAEDMEIQRKLIPLLLEITEDYLDELFEEKCRQNVLSFSDAEELALDLLGQIDSEGRLCRTELADTLSEQISLIMVDEYQDSNNKQDTLFKLLSKDAVFAEDGLHYGSNAFLVGDVKQSIYSFRQANPENFRRAIAESVPLAECQGTDMARIYLNQNFRSAPGVLDFVNALFGTLMTKQCGEVRYDQNERLNFGSPVYAGSQLRTEILIPQPEEPLPEDTDVQAECIADTIDNMLQNQTPVLENGTTRPCEPGDFCVLMRSPKQKLEAMEKAFRRRGIPVAGDRDSGLLGLPEIRLIRNLLRIVDNPMTDAAMAAVLVSPVCGFTAEDLALLKAYGQKNRLYLQLRAIDESETLPDALRPLQTKCTEFLRLLSGLRRTAEQTALEDCIQQIYDITDLLSLQGLYDDAAQRREHLEIFMQTAQRYRENADLTSQSCLSGWLRYLDRLTESGNDLEVRTSAADRSCVQIKTIHKSKGLEFPFVFLAHPEHKFNTSSDSQECFHADESGLVGLHLFDRERLLKVNTAACRLLLAELRRRQKSEEMRLLYVALTRAKQKLFLVMDRVQKGDVKTGTAFCNLGGLLQSMPGMAPLLAERASRIQDWLLCFLLSTPEEIHFTRAMEHGENSSSALVDYCVWTKNTAPARTQATPTEMHAVADKDLLAQMEQQLAFRYSSPYTDLAAKYSVTQLAHPESSMMELARTPAFTLEGSSGRKKTLSGAARGTAVHKILQYMDFSAAAQNPTAELQRLQTQGFLSTAEAQAIPPEQLAAFFAGELYARIAAAKEICREKQLFVRIGELSLPENSVLGAQYAGTDGVLIGTMDLLFREEDGWVLVDYKTDYAREGETLLREYSLQLGLYQKAAELILGEPVKEAFLYSFTLGKALKIESDKICY